MASLKASGADATVTAVADTQDQATINAWHMAGARIVKIEQRGRAATFAEKVNVAYRQTSAPWLLLVGDDVAFHPGWDTELGATFARTRAAVVGTNDLSPNPQVQAGEHSCHPLIARRYIDELGASLDGPRVVCHEGYHHNFVDDEIVTLAKIRQTWAFAADAVVEHLHPAWAKGEWDDTYRLGCARQEDDRLLYIRRFVDRFGDRIQVDDSLLAAIDVPAAS